MFPGRYGRRNVVNRCSVVNWLPGVPVLLGVGLLVQILDVDAGFVVCGVVFVVFSWVLSCGFCGECG